MYRYDLGDFRIHPPTTLTIDRIRDNFVADRIVQSV